MFSLIVLETSGLIQFETYSIPNLKHTALVIFHPLLIHYGILKYKANGNEIKLIVFVKCF